MTKEKINDTKEQKIFILFYLLFFVKQNFYFRKMSHAMKYKK